jgi:hypothetical protein
MAEQRKKREGKMSTLDCLQQERSTVTFCQERIGQVERLMSSIDHQDLLQIRKGKVPDSICGQQFQSRRFSRTNLSGRERTKKKDKKTINSGEGEKKRTTGTFSEGS